MDESRRRFLRVMLAAPLELMIASRIPDVLAAGTDSPAPEPRLVKAAAGLEPTPECGDDDEPTPAETAGPFYTPNSPLRASLLEPGTRGTRVVLTGFVLTRACRTVPGALVDVWHADDDGEYDNVGFKLRGHQFTDARGAFKLETIVPGLYPGRTRHFHVCVQAPKGRILTTQLYFPGEPKNRRDYLYRPELEMETKDGRPGKLARFHFMLDQD